MLISLELVQTHTHEDHDFTYDVSQKNDLMTQLIVNDIIIQKYNKYINDIITPHGLIARPQDVETIEASSQVNTLSSLLHEYNIGLFNQFINTWTRLVADSRPVVEKV